MYEHFKGHVYQYTTKMFIYVVCFYIDIHIFLQKITSLRIKT